MIPSCTSAFRKIGNMIEAEFTGRIPHDGELKRKSFSRLLEKVPGHPEADYGYLVERARKHASLGERRIETTAVLRVRAIDGKIVEREAILYDREKRVRAIASWKQGEGVSCTRVDY